MHILGGPGSGKSKLLEFLIRHDVDRLLEDELNGIDPKQGRSCGLCFLDASDNGATIQKVIAYCEEVGFEKVLVIDPNTHYTHKKLPAINPFSKYETFWSMSIDSLVDVFTVVFEVEDRSKTSFINTYLGALSGLIQFAGLTASDLSCFTVSPNKKDDKEAEIELSVQEKRRQQIYRLVEEKIKSNDFPGIWRDIAYTHLANVKNAYSSIPNFVREAGSTARRLNVLAFNPILKLIFGHRQGVNFDKLVSEGWVILVNVSGRRHLGQLENRLLGTVVVNQIISSILRIEDKGRSKPYYLYIDEAGDFMTYTLAEILEKHRKIGIRTILAHQHMGQLKDAYIRGAIETCTDIKCVFYIPIQKHRREAMDMVGYGGDLSPDEVAFNLSSQPKREMVVKLSRQKPQVIRVPDTPDSDGDAAFWLGEIMKDEHYYTFSQIKEDERERFKALPSENSEGYQSRKKTDRKTTSKAPIPGRVQDRPKEDLPPDNEAPRKDGKRKPLNI